MLSSHTEGSLFYNSSAMVQLKFSLILLGELVLAHAAERADPILGQLIEGNITVVNITANRANPLHIHVPPKSFGIFLGGRFLIACIYYITKTAESETAFLKKNQKN